MYHVFEFSFFLIETVNEFRSNIFDDRKNKKKSCTSAKKKLNLYADVFNNNNICADSIIINIIINKAECKFFFWQKKTKKRQIHDYCYLFSFFCHCFFSSNIVISTIHCVLWGRIPRPNLIDHIWFMKHLLEVININEKKKSYDRTQHFFFLHLLYCCTQIFKVIYTYEMLMVRIYIISSTNNINTRLDI